MARSIYSILIFLMTVPIISAQTETLVVGYTNAPPFIVESENGVSGVNIWLWEKVAKDLDLRFELVPMTFNDQLNALKKGTIDISVNPLTLTPDRAAAFNFTSPFFVSNSTAVVLQKRSNRLRSFLVNFFSWEFIAGITLLFILITVFGALTWFFERKNNSNQFRPSRKGIWDGLWWSAVTMTTVGYGDKSPKSRGGKIVALIWMFTALLFISGLTGSIASSIMSLSADGSATDIYDLRSDDVGTIAATGTVDFLKSRFFENISLYSSVNEGLDALVNEEIETFIYDEPILAYLINQRTDNKIRFLPIKCNLQLYGFGVAQSRDDLTHILSERILYHTSSLEWPVVLREYELEEL